MAKNISKNIISVNVNSVKAIMPINRKSSIFTHYPTLSVELEALTRIYMSVGQKIEDLHKDLRVVEAIEAQKQAFESIAVKAWDYYRISKMSIPYNEQTRKQSMDINHDMLRCIETMPDRNKLTVSSVKQSRKRLSVNTNTLTDNPLQATDNDLINQVCLQFNAAPLGALPEDIRLQFNRTTARKYTAVSCYFQQLQNKTGSGIIADIIRANTNHPALLTAVNNSGLHETTISRFRYAFKLYTGTN